MKATVRSPADGGAVVLHIEGITCSAVSGGAAGPARIDPTPEELLAASLASCTATTIELYARRKNWDVGEIEVEVDYAPAQRGSPTRCETVVRLPQHLLPEQRARLMQIGATSPVHRTLDGEIEFEERIELTVAPKAETRRANRGAPGKRIALLNGLWRALRTPPG